MKNARIDIGSIRREQIVEAAMSIIAQQGIQHLSLSEIEAQARMSRGQLTYYFRTKEDILLAVFQRVVELMRRRIESPGEVEAQADPCRFADLGAWELARHILEKILTEPPPNPAFGALQHTFLAQINHREDFRQALAQLYELWRADMTRRIEADLARRPSSVSPRALASFIQALMHGLAMQKMADPEAIDAQEMIALCRDLLGNVLPLAT